MSVDLVKWVCDVCHEIMTATKVGKNKWEISCPKCGETWYVDNNGDYIDE